MPLSYDSPEMIYVMLYCYKYHPECDYDEVTGEPYPVTSSIVEIFIKRYNKILSSLPKQFTQDQFDAFEQMQEYLQKIKLPAVEQYADSQEKIAREQGNPITLNRQALKSQALFGFLVFIYYTVNHLFEEDAQIAYTDAIDEINQFITDNIDKKLKIKLTAGKKSKEVKDLVLLKAMFAVFNCKKDYYKDITWEEEITILGRPYTIQRTLRDGAPFIVRPLSATKRYKSYLFIKIIMEEVLEWDSTKTKYAPDKTALCLCLLHFCGFLLGDPTKVCDPSNAITLIRLFADFKNIPSSIPDSAFFYIFYST